jgi:branched-chain amino acid transport system ATP-binding protein
VQARYGAVKALHGVTLNVGEGELVAVLGANGAGKTTTLRAVSGTVRRDGDVVFGGRKLPRRAEATAPSWSSPSGTTCGSAPTRGAAD